MCYNLLYDLMLKGNISYTVSVLRTLYMYNSMAETEIPYFETEIAKESSPLAITLAKHLHSIGAKLYGAFWCSHCHDQKEVLPFMFYFQSIHIVC